MWLKWNYQTIEDACLHTSSVVEMQPWNVRPEKLIKIYFHFTIVLSITKAFQSRIQTIR